MQKRLRDAELVENGTVLWQLQTVERLASINAIDEWGERILVQSAYTVDEVYCRRESR